MQGALLNQTVELSLSLLSATRQQQQQHYSYEKRGVELWSHTHTHSCCLSPRPDERRNGGLLDRLRDPTSLVRLCREPTKVTKRKLFLTYLVMNYLVDPASSHMLVSKIKPCMSKYN